MLDEITEAVLARHEVSYGRQPRALREVPASGHLVLEELRTTQRYEMYRALISSLPILRKIERIRRNTPAAIEPRRVSSGVARTTARHIDTCGTLVRDGIRRQSLRRASIVGGALG